VAVLSGWVLDLTLKTWRLDPPPASIRPASMELLTLTHHRGMMLPT
jgi:hypothetical protein